MAEFCDLHLHSTASDGTDAPHDLPRLCRDAGLSAFALTDHDTTAGLAACAAAAKKIKIDFVPGIELSANPDLNNTGQPVGTLHILGYFIDPQDAGLAAISQRMIDARAQRNPRIIEKLNAQGVRITYEQVLDRAQGLAGTQDGDKPIETIVGRPHIAQVLIDAGYVKSIHEAFTKYLGPAGGAYTRRDRLSAEEAIHAIHAAGGLASLAHPVQLDLPDDAALERFVAKLVDLGLDGIETRHSDHTSDDVERFSRIAERFVLHVTGGSDYHGSRKSVRLNSQAVPRSVYENLQTAIDRRDVSSGS